jgi:hypothetical protein
VSKYLLLVLWLAPLLVSINLRRPMLAHIFVNLGLYALMLLAGCRYLTLQRKLMVSAYEFIVVLFSKRPESVTSQEAPDKLGCLPR